MTYNKEIRGLICCVLLGLIMILYYGLTLIYPELGRNHPERSVLISVKGTVDWVKETGKSHDTIRFKLNESRDHFVYNSIGGMSQFIKEALEIPNQNIEVLVDMSDSHSPLFDEKYYYSVYELKSDSRSIRTYDEIKKSSLSDFKSILWVGLFFLVLSMLGLLYEIYRQRKKT